jgi:disulfide bond formation protein DsbB
MLTSYILVYIYIIYETSNNTPINIVLYWIILIGTVFNLYLVLGHKENRKDPYTVLISILLFFILAAINKGLA